MLLHLIYIIIRTVNKLIIRVYEDIILGNFVIFILMKMKIVVHYKNINKNKNGLVFSEENTAGL